MTNPLLVSPRWELYMEGLPTAFTAVINARHIRSDVDAAETTLYLDVEEDDDDAAEASPDYLWRYGVGEEESGFGEAEYEHGHASDLAEAKRQCWQAVIAFLLGEGYSDEEIATAV